MADESDELKGENDENKTTFKMNSFTFKKTTTNKSKSNLLTTTQLQQNDLNLQLQDDNDNNDDDDKNKIDFITSIDDKEIRSTNNNNNNNNKNESSITIPLIKVNKYRFERCNSVDASPIYVSNKNEDDDLDDDDIVKKAKQELLNDSSMIDDEEQLLPAWKSLFINKLSDEYENSDKCDVSMRPSEPKPMDYERIPVNVFGAAVLRGMGWQEDKPIGGVNKAIAPIIEPQLRPLGLGLGTDISIKKQLKNQQNQRKDEQQQQILRKGCYVCIEFGHYKGYYGQVEELMGNESIYANVRLTLLKDRCVSILQDLLRIVTKQEYDSESKVLNKSRYDDYVKHHQHQHRDQQHKERRRSRSSSRSHSRERRRSSYHEHMDDDGDEDVWILPKIRVQIIDKNYKNGRYYKEKVIINETRGTECICRTKDKKLLYNLQQSMLRTVIPSLSSSESTTTTTESATNVMILRGKYRGKLAKIDEIDWNKEIAMINLSGYISRPFSISLDYISEYRDE